MYFKFIHPNYFLAWQVSKGTGNRRRDSLSLEKKKIMPRHCPWNGDGMAHGEYHVSPKSHLRIHALDTPFI
jgi:hypothetical protein